VSIRPYGVRLAFLQRHINFNPTGITPGIAGLVLLIFNDRKNMKTVFCVAAESSGSGSVDWFDNQQAANAQYQTFAADNTVATDTLTSFSLEVPDHATPGEITELADEAMWHMTYQCAERRIGTDGIHASLAVSAT